MDVLEKLTRRLAKKIVSDGRLVLTHDGDPDLIEAFAQLGWADHRPVDE